MVSDVACFERISGKSLLYTVLSTDALEASHIRHHLAAYKAIKLFHLHMHSSSSCTFALIVTT